MEESLVIPGLADSVAPGLELTEVNETRTLGGGGSTRLNAGGSSGAISAENSNREQDVIHDQ